MSLVEEVKFQDLTVVRPTGGLVNQLTSEAKPDRRAELLQQLNPKLDHLTPGQRAQIEECLLSYVDVFALDASDPGTTDLAEHRINTGDHAPIQQPARRMPFTLRDQMVGEMLSQDIIVTLCKPMGKPRGTRAEQRWRNAILCGLL